MQAGHRRISIFLQLYNLYSVSIVPVHPAMGAQLCVHPELPYSSGCSKLCCSRWQIASFPHQFQVAVREALMQGMEARYFWRAFALNFVSIANQDDQQLDEFH